jgi:hypothetical protein
MVRSVLAGDLEGSNGAPPGRISSEQLRDRYEDASARDLSREV